MMAVYSLFAATVGVITAVATGKLLNVMWEVVTNSEPPDPLDPEITTGEALSWAIASSVGMGVAQLIVKRTVTSRWNRTSRSPKPVKPSRINLQF